MQKLKNNYWVTSAFFTIAQRLSVPLFGVGSFLILIRTLDEQEMGSWVLFLNITTIIEVVRNGLVKGATVKFINSASEKDHNAIKSASLVINIIYTVATLGILLVGAKAISTFLNTPQLVTMFYYYSISAAIFIPFSHLEFIQQSNMRFNGIFYSYFSKQGIFFILIVVGVLFFPDTLNVADLVLLQAAGLLIGTIVAYMTSRTLLTHTFEVSKTWITDLWQFGKYGLYTNFSNSILTTTDQLLLGNIVSTASVAIYNAALRITNIFIIPSVAVADILYPKSVKAHESQGTQEVKNLYEKAVGANLVPIIPMLLVILIFPELIIRLLAGERYIEAVSVLRVSILGILVLPFLKQFGTVMNAIDKPQYNFYFVLALSCFNLIGNYLFITKMGIIGAAYATLLTYIIGFIACQIILKQLVASTLMGVISRMLVFYRSAFLMIRKLI
uniref:Flippase n=1 Tax=Roseihalotalea indica TaxID=2867963 RepID=A0AA49GK06_9BACT|nr:flippase [Tunicatimonas sp. TK19036]